MYRTLRPPFLAGGCGGAGGYGGVGGSGFGSGTGQRGVGASLTKVSPAFQSPHSSMCVFCRRQHVPALKTTASQHDVAVHHALQSAIVIPVFGGDVFHRKGTVRRELKAQIRGDARVPCETTGDWVVMAASAIDSPCLVHRSIRRRGRGNSFSLGIPCTQHPAGLE